MARLCLGLLVVIFSVLVHYVIGQNESCLDCRSVKSCPAAVKLLQGELTEEVKQTLRNAFCRYTNAEPYVCCEKISQKTTVRTENRSYLDDHPNLKLLPDKCGVISGDRIFGGTETGIYEYPWMALISYVTKDQGLAFKCGGSLINSRYVLTAAHCIINQNIAGVRIGEHDIRSDTDCEGTPPKITCESRIQDMRVEQTISHENYTQTPFIQNDIGLLRLRKPVDFIPKNARPLCLPTTGRLRNLEITGQIATVAGWGYTESGSTSDVLLSVRVPIYSQEECAKLYDKVLKGKTTLNKFCAGELGRDTCGGDSGGPLLVSGEHEGVTRYIQYGIVSYGPRRCASQYPGVYTDVTKYMDWILNTIRE